MVHQIPNKISVVSRVTIIVGNKSWVCTPKRLEALKTGVAALGSQGVSFSQLAIQNGMVQGPNTGRKVALEGFAKVAVTVTNAAETETSRSVTVHASETRLRPRLFHGRSQEALGPVEEVATEKRIPCTDIAQPMEAKTTFQPTKMKTVPQFFEGRNAEDIQAAEILASMSIQPTEKKPAPQFFEGCTAEDIQAAEILASMLVRRKRQKRMRVAGKAEPDQPMAATIDPRVAAANASFTAANAPITVSNAPITAAYAPIEAAYAPSTAANAPITAANASITAANAPMTAAERPLTASTTAQVGQIIMDPVPFGNVDDMVIDGRRKGEKRCQFCEKWFEDGKDMKRHCNARERKKNGNGAKAFLCPKSPKFPIYCPVSSCPKKMNPNDWFSQQ